MKHRNSIRKLEPIADVLPSHIRSLFDNAIGLFSGKCCATVYASNMLECNCLKGFQSATGDKNITTGSLVSPTSPMVEFYMNAVINRLTTGGFAFAGNSTEEIVMNRVRR